ncbi:sensor histidine kinase [Cohnella soli]|uniref:Sensor histidine kinase n=1 Tax=Cohnella soli TaxID=425005 RepID=A0ABW0HRT8_9BACL
MRYYRSLPFKLGVGFAGIIVPLILLLLYNNLYSMNVVRKQVAESHKSMLEIYTNQMDSFLEQTSNYLLRLAFQYAGITSLSLNDPESDEYTLTKIQVRNQIDEDISKYNWVGMLFVYSPGSADLITTESGDAGKQIVREQLAGMLADKRFDPANYQTWRAVSLNGEACLMRLVQNDFNVYTGAWISVKRLMEPMSAIQLSDSGRAAILSTAGDILTPSTLRQDELPAMLKMLSESDKTYGTLSLSSRTLVVSHASRQSDTILLVMTPEEKLLSNLPLYQRIIYVVPFAALLILLLFLFFVRSIILKPINQLLIGMKRIKEGNLSFRLKRQSSKEFGTMADMFNEMAAEVTDLKISVYEEQIRWNKAEIRQLQLQIQPHFLLNSLNVVYNLAESKEYKLVQKMIRHLMNYFRFITRTSTPLVRIDEELKHIDTYLQIQQMRFPQSLSYRIDLAAGMEAVMLPPLLFQPFVENAIIHGYDKISRTCTVHISVDPDEDEPTSQFRVTIADSGRGFAEEQADRLTLGAADDYEHIGIRNVVQRLKFHYGDQARLTFSNKPEGGAVVCLYLPIQTTAG